MIDGGAGSDTVSYAAASHAMLINLTGQVTTDGIVTDTLSSIENAVGSRFNDTIFGNDFDNVLDGGVEGSDQIFGGSGPTRCPTRPRPETSSSTSPAR